MTSEPKNGARAPLAIRTRDPIKILAGRLRIIISNLILLSLINTNVIKGEVASSLKQRSFISTNFHEFPQIPTINSVSLYRPGITGNYLNNLIFATASAVCAVCMCPLLRWRKQNVLNEYFVINLAIH